MTPVARRTQFKFRLYVAGNAMNSTQAVANLKDLCRTRLAGRCDIEVIDVFKDPKRALAEGIFLTPTLVRVSPLPGVRIVGTLSQVRPLLYALGLETSPA